MIVARNPQKAATAIDQTPTRDENSTVLSFSHPNSLKRSSIDQYFQVNSSKTSKHQTLLVSSTGKNIPRQRGSFPL